eukprot:jgi/Psemu1/256624/estExt_Genewise1Plus.C_1900003
MGAIATNKDGVPEKAKGNPVYEQTRQDMPLWCCGTNCGRNSRITVFILATFGILCSSFVCVSPNYFSFESLRNDTFYDEDKRQPKPFEYATEANVGLFRYQITEVFEYPWPPEEQRELFDAMHNRELERLAESDRIFNTRDEEYASSGQIMEDIKLLQNNLAEEFDENKFPETFYADDDTAFDGMTGDDDNAINATNYQNGTYSPQQNDTYPTHQNDTTKIVLTRSPSTTPPPTNEIPDVLPGSNAISRIPTDTPTSSPTRGNPNDDIDVVLDAVNPYPAGVKFDSFFKNGQKGALWAPIFAGIGLIFATTEFLCCVYKCSWLPTALCMYAAFMLQLMTLFLFMSDDFCNYAQDCELGVAGWFSVSAVLAYLICQTLICMTPRPPPKFDLCNRKTTRKKKKKKKTPANEWDETDPLNADEDGFTDEPNKPTSYIGAYDDANDDQYDHDYDYRDADYDDGYGDDDGYSNGDQGLDGYGDHALEDYDSDEYSDDSDQPTAGRRKK